MLTGFSKKKVIIICGGPSLERGISLNSARSLYDNLDKDRYEVGIIYFNPKLEAFPISSDQIYSNTPLDFDFKLPQLAKPLDKTALREELHKFDLAFPAIHGAFGEDGQLQTLLEEIGLPYVGSNSVACRTTCDKFSCQEALRAHKFFTLPGVVIKKDEPIGTLPEGRLVAKPLRGGSSIGVEYFANGAELQSNLDKVFRYEDEVLVEPECHGTEFTVIVLQNDEGDPVALLPTEIELPDDKFFDYRKKYLPSNMARYHTPARFTATVIQQIRNEAERAFRELNMKDVARFDGWILPDGKVWLSDINAVSGMEQNSFLFQQAALLGLSHTQLLTYLIEKTLVVTDEHKMSCEEIPVLFGGATAERQVSVISGTNVIMKLKQSLRYRSLPYFFQSFDRVVAVPHYLCLLHTVEEISEKIEWLQSKNVVAELMQASKEVLDRLHIPPNVPLESLFVPRVTTLAQLGKQYPFIFLGLHGGQGEDGTVQRELDRMGVAYNGSGAAASAQAMDKYITGSKIISAGIQGVSAAEKIMIAPNDSAAASWQKIVSAGLRAPYIIKPRADGCSAGVIRVDNFAQFSLTLSFFQGDAKTIPAGAIHGNHGIIDLPQEKVEELLVEEFVETDRVQLQNMELCWNKINDWIEVTVGVLGEKGNLHALFPSQTVTAQGVLSLEEKFMGGTGINFTPPPVPPVAHAAIVTARQRVAQVAEALGLEGYARIDTFMHIKTGELIIIEANTLPALTPSTVLFHQSFADETPRTPLELIEEIIRLGKNR